MVTKSVLKMALGRSFNRVMEELEKDIPQKEGARGWGATSQEVRRWFWIRSGRYSRDDIRMNVFIFGNGIVPMRDDEAERLGAEIVYPPVMPINDESVEVWETI